ncbi:hypothetical protein BHE74_00015065 [Ensete ventricosum]|nr:hypothetical protein BHE74_00015065 [Ensete ventricosum]
MEDRAPEKQSSYTYWVREATEDVAPRPVPRKLSAADLSKQPRPAVLGSSKSIVCAFSTFSMIQVRLSGDDDLSTDDKMKICNDLRLYLAPIRKKLEVFEQELRDR